MKQRAVITHQLERTPESQRHFDQITAEIPVTAPNQLDLAAADGYSVDPFDDDEPIVAACDLENPESCESCQ